MCQSAPRHPVNAIFENTIVQTDSTVMNKIKLIFRLTLLVAQQINRHAAAHRVCAKSGMSNMRPFASTPAARTKDTVIWSFNDQNCSFYNLNWINVRRSQKNSMLFFIQNVFYTWKYDRSFPSVKKISFFLLLNYITLHS